MNLTPTLSGKEADDFLARVAEGLKHKADFTPTPRLEIALELILIRREMVVDK